MKQAPLKRIPQTLPRPLPRNIPFRIPKQPGPVGRPVSNFLPHQKPTRDYYFQNNAPPSFLDKAAKHMTTAASKQFGDSMLSTAKKFGGDMYKSIYPESMYSKFAKNLSGNINRTPSSALSYKPYLNSAISAAASSYFKPNNLYDTASSYLPAVDPNNILNTIRNILPKNDPQSFEGDGEIV